MNTVAHQPTPINGPLSTEDEMRRLLHCCRSTIRKLRAQGMPVVRLPECRAVRYDAGAVLQWLHEQQHQGNHHHV